MNGANTALRAGEGSDGRLLELYREHTGHTPTKVTDTDGGEYAGPCPVCRGKDRFRMWPARPPHDNQFWCRKCGTTGDLPGFLMTFKGMKYLEALAKLDLETRRYVEPNNPPVPSWLPLCPIPSEAGDPNPIHPKHGKPTQIWTYKDAGGNPLGYVCRFDFDSGDKAVLPLVYCQGPNGKRAWRWQGFTKPCALYNLDQMAERHEAPVVVVEGEKSADAAQQLLPDHVVTTSPGGCGGAAKADWSPLRGREVVVWPDADQPGLKYAETVARLTHEAGATSVAVVEFPEDLPEGWDLADALPDSWDSDTIIRLVLGARRRKLKVKTKTWPMPVPFDDYNSQPLPVEVFPTWAQDFIQALAEHLQVAPCLVVANVLGTVSAATARKFCIEVKPGFREPLNLYVLAPAPPAERKTATQMLALAPLYKWESEKAKAMEDEIRRAASEQKSQSAIISGLRGKLAKAADGERKGLIREIADLEAGLIEVPRPPRLMADDITPEATGVLMAQNDERLLIASCEGGIFDILAGRYSGGIPNLDLILKAHSGEPVRVDRKNGSPVIMNSPAMTMCLSLQPEVLMGLTSKKGFRGRGLLGRFIYVQPESLLGRRIVDTPSIPYSVKQAYQDAQLKLLNLPWCRDNHGGHTSYVLQLTPDAYRAWTEFAEYVEKELREGGAFEMVRDWAGKLPGLAARLAGNLHVMEHLELALERPVEAETMRRALKLAAALVGHALQAFSMMGADPIIEAAKHVLAWIQREQVGSFTVRECHRAVRGRYPRSNQVKEALEVLKERDYIQTQTAPSPKGPGRPPGASYVVNPAALKVA